MTVQEWIAKGTGAVVLIPKGTKVGHRWTLADGTVTNRYETGAHCSDVVTNADTRIEIQIDQGSIESLAFRVLRAKGKRARQGPIHMKRLR